MSINVAGQGRVFINQSLTPQLGAAALEVAREATYTDRPWTATT